MNTLETKHFQTFLRNKNQRSLLSDLEFQDFSTLITNYVQNKKNMVSLFQEIKNKLFHLKGKIIKTYLHKIRELDDNEIDNDAKIKFDLELELKDTRCEYL